MASLMLCALATVAVSLLAVPGVLTLSCTRTYHSFPPPSPLPVALEIKECSGDQVLLSLFSLDPVAEVGYSCIDPTNTESMEQNGGLFFGDGMAQEVFTSVVDLTPGIVCSFSGCYYHSFLDFTIHPTACTLGSKVPEVTETFQAPQSSLTSYRHSEDLMMSMDTTETLLVPIFTTELSAGSTETLKVPIFMITTKIPIDTTEIVSDPLPTTSPTPQEAGDITTLTPLESGIDTTTISPGSPSTSSVAYSLSLTRPSSMEHTSTPTHSTESASPTRDPSMVPHRGAPLHPRWIILAVVLAVASVAAVAGGLVLMGHIALQKRERREKERQRRYYFQVLRGHVDVIDRNYKPVRRCGEEWALRQSVESIVTVYEMLQMPPATNTQSLNCSVGINNNQSTPCTYDDSSKETPSKVHSVEINLTSDVSFQPASPEKVPVLHSTSEATRSSVSSDYICADSPMLPGLSRSTSSDHDSCFSANCPS